MTAFEFKASRSDWLRELKDPEKADGICQQVHEFYVVAEPDVVDRGEVPEAWGLIERKKQRLYTVTKAPRSEVEPPDFYFLASIMRQLHNSISGMRRGYVHEDDIEEKIEERAEKATKSALREQRRELDLAKRLRAEVEEFEAASGVEIANGWNHGKIGSAVKFVMRSGSGIPRAIERAKTLLEEQAQKLQALQAALNEAPSDEQ